MKPIPKIYIQVECENATDEQLPEKTSFEEMHGSPSFRLTPNAFENEFIKKVQGVISKFDVAYNRGKVLYADDPERSTKVAELFAKLTSEEVSIGCMYYVLQELNKILQLENQITKEQADAFHTDVQRYRESRKQFEAVAAAFPKLESDSPKSFFSKHCQQIFTSFFKDVEFNGLKAVIALVMGNFQLEKLQTRNTWFKSMSKCQPPKIGV